MNKSKVAGIAIAGSIIVIVAIIMFAQPKKIKHTYEPATDLTEIRECVKKVTGSPILNIEELAQNQQMFAYIYRFCLKTAEDIEATLLELAQ